LNKLQNTYLNIIHALINVEGIFDHGSDTQYGLINYIAKFSLGGDSYFISDYAYSKLSDESSYRRRGSFPKKIFTFEHPIPANVIRTMLKDLVNEGSSIDKVAEILTSTDYVVALTQEENSRIRKEYKTKLPNDWKLGDDPFVRYKDTGIVITRKISVQGAIVR
jgi:hypothetical protein